MIITEANILTVDNFWFLYELSKNLGSIPRFAILYIYVWKELLHETELKPTQTQNRVLNIDNRFNVIYLDFAKIIFQLFLM